MRVAAGTSGYLTLVQSGDRPQRYGLSRRLATMPARPMRQAWRNAARRLSKSETPSSRQTTPSDGLLLLWLLFLLLLRLFHSDQRLLLVRADGIFHRRNRVTDVDGDQQAFQHFDITRHPANFGLADTALFLGSRVLAPALDELFVRARLIVHAALVVL